MVGVSLPIPLDNNAQFLAAAPLTVLLIGQAVRKPANVTNILMQATSTQPFMIQLFRPCSTGGGTDSAYCLRYSTVYSPIATPNTSESLAVLWPVQVGDVFGLAPVDDGAVSIPFAMPPGDGRASTRALVGVFNGVRNNTNVGAPASEGHLLAADFLQDLQAYFTMQITLSDSDYCDPDPNTPTSTKHTRTSRQRAH